jgi:hypothetical protein
MTEIALNRCIICKNKILGIKKKYCSKECYKKAKVWNKRKHKVFASRLCLNCNKEFLPDKDAPNRLYCSQKCKSRKNYLDKKEEKIIYSKNYSKKFKERDKEKRNLNQIKWRNKNKDKFNKLMKAYRKKNKEKNNSRDVTWDVLKCYRKGKIVEIDKKCKKCDTAENIQIHHEIYPKNREETRKAIKEGKIYYLCRKHHTEWHNKNKELKNGI